MGYASKPPQVSAIDLTRLRSANTWEELEALPGFRPEQVAVDVMRRGTVVGQYSMSGNVLRPCGISSCSRPHKHGFIVELADATLSHVGKDCGKSKMGVVFNQMLARYRKTKKAAAKAQAAGEARVSAKLAIAEALKMPATLQAVKVLLNTLDSLTPRMKNLLERHAANNDGRIIRFRDPTNEEIQRAEFMGAPKPTRFREEIAIINEVKAVAPNSRADFVADKRIPWAVAELTAMVDDMAVDADAIVAKTRALRDTRDLLDHSIERAARFFVPSNIAKLGYLEDVNAPRRVTFDVGPPPRLVVE